MGAGLCLWSREEMLGGKELTAPGLASHQNRVYLSRHIFPSFVKASGGLLGPATGNRHLGRPEGGLPGSGGLHLPGGLSLRFQPWGRAAVPLPLDGSFQVCWSQGPRALTFVLNAESMLPLPGD